MIQPDDELGKIVFTAEIDQLAEHALNPNLARRALQFDCTNHLSHKYPLHSLYFFFYNFQLRKP